MNTNKTSVKCEKCDCYVTYKNMARHHLTKKHLRNDPDLTLKPRKRKPNKPKEEKPNQPKEKNV